MRRMVTIYFDEQNGSAERVDYSPAFLAGGSLMMADCLKDALYMMGKDYRKALKAFYRELRTEREKAAAVATLVDLGKEGGPC